MKTQKLSLSQAVAGYLLNLEARHLSRNTINDYTNTLHKFASHIGNPDISTITPLHITEYLAAQTTVSNKTLSNYHSTLSALWTWLERQGLANKNIIRQIDRPKPERRQITPLELHEVQALIKAINKSKTYARPGKRSCANSLSNADRNLALLLFMLDNGVRATEVCELKVGQMDEKNQRVFVLGKGSKERFLPYSARTGQVIWRYLTKREDLDPDDYLFVTQQGRQMNRRLIHQTLEDLGARAGVENVHPHRLRHTFAVSYLRAGGDIFTLQMILGHENLDMVRHYSKLASMDVKRVHRRASPVEFFKL